MFLKSQLCVFGPKHCSQYHSYPNFLTHDPNISKQGRSSLPNNVVQHQSCHFPKTFLSPLLEKQNTGILNNFVLENQASADISEPVSLSVICQTSKIFHYHFVKYWRIKLLEKATPWKGIHLTSRLLNTTFAEERPGICKV